LRVVKAISLRPPRKIKFTAVVRGALDASWAPRLLGFERVELAPGASRTVPSPLILRLLATFDGKLLQWRLVSGTYRVARGKSAGDLVSTREATLTDRVFAN
jgi:hypothetical protein